MVAAKLASFLQGAFWVSVLFQSEYCKTLPNAFLFSPWWNSPLVLGREQAAALHDCCASEVHLRATIHMDLRTVAFSHFPYSSQKATELLVTNKLGPRRERRFTSMAPATTHQNRNQAFPVKVTKARSSMRWAGFVTNQQKKRPNKIPISVYFCSLKQHQRVWTGRMAMDLHQGYSSMELFIKELKKRAETPGTWPAQICNIRSSRWAVATRIPSDWKQTEGKTQKLFKTKGTEKKI